MFRLLAVIMASIIGQSYERDFKSISLSTAINKFNLDLLKNLYNEDKNVFISPFSISTAFGMLYGGAKGQTAEELRDVLGYDFANITDEQINQQFSDVLTNFESIDSNKYELKIANKILLQKDFEILKSFAENLRNNFKSSVNLVDFADSDVTTNINNWVSNQTNDKIKKLLDENLDKSTVLVILNAIYFKGFFQAMFSKNNTREEVFFNGGNTEKMTQMMKRSGKFNITRVTEIDSQLLEIPYSGDDISLYILLPNQREGLKQLMSGLNSWTLIENSIAKLFERTVDVMIPKFKIEDSYELKEKLSEMGIKLLFNSSADLSAINGKHDLQVSKVIHKAFIEVNEEGTEAAAATAVVVTRMLRPAFRADHPFMFFIRDNNNGMTLFAGYVNQL